MKWTGGESPYWAFWTLVLAVVLAAGLWAIARLVLSQIAAWGIR